MTSYYVRACLPFDFVSRMKDEGIDPVKRLGEELKEKCSAEIRNNCYTFGLYIAEAESEDDCRAKFSAAWDKLYPQEREKPVFLIAKNDGSDGAELMRSVFAGYYGADEYLQLTVELYNCIPLLAKAGALAALRSRSYVFAVDPGCGFTTLLSSFGDFLHRMHVYGENDEKRTYYTEYRIGRETGGGYTTPADLISAISDAEEIEKTNILGIDLGYFLEGGKFDELRAFAQRLGKYGDDYVYVFRVPYLEKKALDDIVSVLSDVMLVRTVKVPPLHDIVLFEHMWYELYTMGYDFSQSVSEQFFERVRREKQDGRFYGFKTVTKIVCGMILEKAAHDSALLAAGGDPDEKKLGPADLGAVEMKKERSGYEELEELIGMETVSKRIREIVAQVKLSMSSEKLDRPCLHMRFTGAPGTGKTTVARIIGKIFKEEGILRKGAFLEYSARSLCAEYVGQTAVRTASICRDAYGSVLFIDEAYALYEGNRYNNDYGREALTTLISEMENHRDDMLVIMAGYTDDMETLMEGNAGLRSRMPFVIHFPNYSREQLFQIYMLMVRKHFSYTPDLEEAARDFFDSVPEAMLGSRDFANGRYVRNLYERTWSRASLRAALDGAAGVSLTGADLRSAAADPEFSEMPEKTVRVGFSKN